MSLRTKAAATHAADGRSLAAVLAAGQLKPTGRGSGLDDLFDGSLASVPEDYLRRQWPDEQLVAEYQYALHKRGVLHQLLHFAKSMPVKSDHVQREIDTHLPEAIAEETEAMRKTNVEIERRHAEGLFSARMS
jgi:hypothetical protein